MSVEKCNKIIDNPKDYFPDINLDNLPEDLKISTMTITYKFDGLIDVMSVGKFVTLSQNRIICVKYGNNKVRSLVKIKSKSKTKKNKKNFYNQATIIIDAGSDRRNNVKLFKNGSVQITGCNGLDNFIKISEILCEELVKYQIVYDRATRKITKKYFFDKPDNITLSKIFDVKIRMINSNFNCDFLINRSKLYNLLTTFKISCSFEPCIHACVNIKFACKNKDIVSIFVFESGSIIITGARNKYHIIEAYQFITKFLYDNYDVIVKNDFDKFLQRPDVQQLIASASRPTNLFSV